MKTNPETRQPSIADAAKPPAWLQIVRDRVAALQFGAVQIVVHEGRVTQVESTQRTRLPAEDSTTR